MTSLVSKLFKVNISNVKSLFPLEHKSSNNDQRFYSPKEILFSCMSYFPMSDPLSSSVLLSPNKLSLFYAWLHTARLIWYQTLNWSKFSPNQTILFRCLLLLFSKLKIFFCPKISNVKKVLLKIVLPMIIFSLNCYSCL